MKYTYLTGLICAVSAACFAQRQNSMLVASASGMDKMAVVKGAMDIDEWHEKSFWPLYGKYANKVEGISLQSYRALLDLAATDPMTSDIDAYDNGIKILNFRMELLNTWQQYYAQIESQFNGVVGLQFLQTEALLDMMESCRIYETTSLKQFRFHPKLLSETEMRAAKYNVLSKALSLSAQQAPEFYTIYARYEEECDALLGEDYSLVGFYAGEASDYTPAIAKHLGYDFLRVMQRELKLKEKYFKEFNQSLGAPTAARFLAWEDYYSLVSKMYAWADAP